MRFIIQHTEHPASLRTIYQGKESTQTIPHGAIIYVGFHRDDVQQYDDLINTFLTKIQAVKLFRHPDSDKIDASLTDTGGHILLIPNFTLYSRNHKGRGVDYTHSASFEDGQIMREYLCKGLLEHDIPHTTGIFGAEMHITATIDGPINHIRDF